MLILKFITIPIIWLIALLICSLRPYQAVEFDINGINDYTLFTALLYLLSTFTINVILSRQVVYDYLHIHARAISFCTGIVFIACVELARHFYGFGVHSIYNIALFLVACLIGNRFFKRIYLNS